jgi:hypothetical protein
VTELTVRSEVAIDRRSCVMRCCVALLAGFALLGAAAPAPAATASAPSQAPVAGDLFVLTAAGGKLERVPGRDRVFRLVLRRPAGDVTVFTDRPARRAGVQTLGRFVRTWPRLGFGQVPPNAALVVADAPSDRDVLVVELSRPRLRAGGRMLAFRAEVLRGSPRGVLRQFARKADRRVADRFGRVSLFIDPSGREVQLAFILTDVPIDEVSIAFANALVDLGDGGVQVFPRGILFNFLLYPDYFTLAAAGEPVTVNVQLAVDVAAGVESLTGTAKVPAGTTVVVRPSATGRFVQIMDGSFSIPLG